MKHRSRLAVTGFIIIAASQCVLAVINTDGNKGDLRTISAQTWGKAKLNIAVGINYEQDGAYVKGPVDPNTHQLVGSTGNPIGPNSDTITVLEPARLFASNLSACMGLNSFWDLALSVPFYYDWSGFTRSYNDGGIGDLEVSTKLRQPPIASIFWQAYYLAVTAPVGMRNNGIFPRHAYLYDKQGTTQDTNPAGSFYSSSVPILKGMVLWSLDFDGLKKPVPLSINLNIGAALSTDWAKRNMVIGSFSIDYSPAEFITLFAEAGAEARWSSFSSGINLLREPFFVSPGLRINTQSGLYLLLAGDFSLSSLLDADRNNWNKDGYRYSTAPAPRYGVQFELGWNGFLVVQDDDKDGLKNDLDRCPKDAEDLDNFEDSDGCPDPDNDRDSVCDPWVVDQHKDSLYANICKGADKCPNDPEDKDGYKDDDGCPDLDNDKDGIPDTKDQCPDQAEDFDGIDDRDGCPDFDNDKDGIADSVDKCPNDPEDFDKFQDNDGCPDPDNDMDGVPDLRDKCPNQPETFNGIDDQDGCPDTIAPPPPKKKEPDLPRTQTLRGISFRTGTAEITPDSYVFMDPIVRKLKEFPEIEIEVRGHTNSLGKYDANMQISQRRAEAVRQYLISLGIDGMRIRAVGMGPNSPIADNRTAAGRNENRRIEIVRTK